MKLGEVLFRLAPRLPRGHIFKGKYRLVSPVTAKDKHELREDLKREEQNLFYLRHPYLTLEQTQGHAKELRKHEKWLKNVTEQKEFKFASKNTTLESELKHMAHTIDWDFKAGAN